MHKKIWTNKQLGEALAINLPGDNSYGEVRFNSQHIEEGDIFIALTGGAGDGHRFVRDAINQGASLAIISSNSGLEDIDNTKLLLVDDTYQTLDKLAIYKRANFKGKVIAITGSVGKTTTKKMTQLMLELYGKTHANFGNFNNNIGVRLTLASLPQDTEYLVLEMGMNHPGEIDKLSKIAKPDIAAITRIGESHIGHFSSIDEIIDAKCEIFNHLNNDDAIAILNSGDNSFSRCYQKVVNQKIKHIHSFGSIGIDEVKILDIKRLMNDRFELHIKTKQQKIKVVTNLIPEHFIENFLCALAIINALSLPIELATSIISQFEPEIGRGKIVQSQILSKKFSIICDFYNSGPPSLSAALTNLSALHNPNKIAILGDMKELGQFETALHEKMISYIHASGIKKLFLVGRAMSNIAKYIDPTIEVYTFPTVEELQSQILDLLQGGELILIKASRSIKLEKVAITLGVNYII